MADLPATPDYSSMVLAVAFSIASNVAKGTTYNTRDDYFKALTNYTIKAYDAILRQEEIKKEK